MNFHSLKISQIVAETTDTKTIYFEIPDAIKNEFIHLPGQYLTIKASIKGKECRRPYSVCTIPGESNMGVTVKKVPNGTMSVYMNENARVGDTLEVMVPEGHFKVIVDQNKCRDHYFFVAGSGITPIMSMIQTILEEEPKSTCYVLYGNRDENNIIFREKIELLLKRYEDQLYADFVLSNPIEKKKSGLGGLFAKKEIEWKGYKGRINDKICTHFLNERPSKNKERQYYICGPGDFIENVDKFLLSIHIEKKDIHKEYFTTISSDENKTITSSSGKITVTLKGETFDMPVPKGKTILEVLVEAKKDAPYSCTSGACSTCMAKVTNGEVTMDSCYALEDDEVAAGYILTCQSRLKTENVSLTFDV